MTSEKKFKNNKKNYKAKPAGKQKQWTGKKESVKYTEKKKTDFKKNTAPKGEQKKLYKEELQLGYRTSVVKEKGYIVLEAVLNLTKGDPEAIKSRMDELKEQRVTKQPLEYPSAGSTFKRPEGYFAGKLIQDAGLRGYQVGGAQVSEKHCGFVINKENATATDVVNLIHDVQRIVYEKFQVQLDTEVKFLGEF